jgi:hypothetical protein
MTAAVALMILLADEGGVSVQSAETLFARGTSAGVSCLLVRAEERRERWAVLALSHGVHEDLTLAAVVPYLSVDAEGEGDAGLADASVFAKLRVLFDGGEGWEATAAVLGGLQLPTGRTARGLDPELRLGSGSWDPFAGAAATYEWDRFEVRVHALCQVNTEGRDDFKHEDLITLGVGGSWRPWVEKYPGPEAGVSLGFAVQHFFGARGSR